MALSAAPKDSLTSELDTIEALTAGQSLRAVISGRRHESVDISEIGAGTALANLDVNQRRVVGREPNLVYCNVFHLNDRLDPDCRNYVDVHPVIAS